MIASGEAVGTQSKSIVAKVPPRCFRAIPRSELRHAANLSNLEGFSTPWTSSARTLGLRPFHARRVLYVPSMCTPSAKTSAPAGCRPRG
eukprot:5841210-Prymnesium_polylepis.2